jgi:tyrosine decarboxylase/aspartate 1-decarboxylase
MATEFGLLPARRRIPFPAPEAFPEDGASEREILATIRELVAQDPWTIETDFALAYAGPPHPIAARAAGLADGTVFVEWTEDMYPSAFHLEKGAVSMVASLLGAPGGVGFITSGGTESNILAVRVARDLAGVSDPEFIMPSSGHFSFRLAGQLLGVRIRTIPIDAERRPDLKALERAIGPNTVGIACSAPEGAWGRLDPVEAIAEIAQRRGIYLHVDAAFGGFILPFLRQLGRPIPPFDFSLPGVTSMSTDGHKLGLMLLPTGFFMVRDAELLTRAIPSDQTMIHTVTSTKSGRTAAAAWAVLRRLGQRGYRRIVRRTMRRIDRLADGIESVDGLRLMTRPAITIVSFTSDRHDVGALFERLTAAGWGSSYAIVDGTPLIRLSLSPYRDERHIDQFVATLRSITAELER